MKITVSLSSQLTTKEAVDAINKKLGTSFTVFDYSSWESGADTPGARQFSAAVEQYVGSTKYKVITTLALAALKVKHLFRSKRS